MQGVNFHPGPSFSLFGCSYHAWFIGLSSCLLFCWLLGSDARMIVFDVSPSQLAQELSHAQADIPHGTHARVRMPHTHTRTHTCTHTHMHVHACQTLTRSQTHKHAHTRAHTHTYTHTYTQGVRMRGALIRSLLPGWRC
jgi:hypothetical protein